MVLYSVIVPIYKGEKYIPDIIGMIQRNAANISEGIELIFVNDYPEKSIRECVNASLDLIKLDSNLADNFSVQVIENDVNSGIHKSRINGINHCQGDFVLMLDQDDKIEDTFFLSNSRYLGKADVVVSNGIEQKDGFDKLLYKYAFMHWTVKYLWFYAKFDSRIISPGQCLIRKDSIPLLWMNNPLKNNGADDYMLWLLMLAKQSKFVINRDSLYTHVYTAGNLSLDVEKIKKSTRELLDIIGDEIGKRNVNLILDRMESGRKSLIVRFVEGMNKK